MAKLYEIDSEILNCIDQETGEILDEERLSQLEMERDTKIENVALWYRNLLSDAEQYKAEKKRFEQLERSSLAKAGNLKEWLTYALQGNKFKTTRVNISYRKSDSVKINNAALVPEKYLVYNDPTINKTLVKKALKDGIAVTGAELEVKQNIQIK
mgnify:CR=1 FL=1|jgi:hypothetical protein